MISLDRPIARDEAALSAYEDWLERLEMTYESVAHCCAYRLQDRALAERASLDVVAGLIERPRVFRHFGLPFSGRVAHLAELAMVEARAGRSSGGGDWLALRSGLREIPHDQQRLFVLTCIEGYGDPELAAALGCDETTAAQLRKAALKRVNDVCRRVLSPVAAGDPEEVRAGPVRAQPRGESAPGR
jgi:hypothetical protein